MSEFNTLKNKVDNGSGLKYKTVTASNGKYFFNPNSLNIFAAEPVPPSGYMIAAICSNGNDTERFIQVYICNSGKLSMIQYSVQINIIYT